MTPRYASAAALTIVRIASPSSARQEDLYGLSGPAV